MKINSFIAQGVHDYLNYNIEFFTDLTFLIGINGSGKTSALKLILGLTSPVYNYLNQIKYKYCEVICSTNNNEKDITIRSVQEEDSFTLTLKIKNGQTYSENIKRFLRKDDASYDYEEVFSLELRHKEIFDNQQVVKKIKEFITPKFLGLDRRIYEGANIDSRFRNKRLNIHSKLRSKGYDGFPEPQAIDVSLEEVQYLIFDSTRRIPQQQFQINDEFKQKIFNQSFEFIEKYGIGQISNSQSIPEKKIQVLQAIQDLGIKGLTTYINTFFDKMEVISKKYEDYRKKQKENIDIPIDEYSDIIIQLYQNGTQLKRIDNIITYSQDYQKKIAELREPFKKLENIVSNFLKEGDKELRIEADGEIKVILKKTNQSTNIYGLSSGEKQIIIMIAHLIFEEAQKESGIFIIDEPELSLHIAWQQIFVESIMQASPKTQFILATHSPSIISKVEREKNCQDLNRLNY